MPDRSGHVAACGCASMGFVSDMPSNPRNRPAWPSASVRLLLAGTVASVLTAVGWQRWVIARTAGDVLEHAMVFEAQLGTRMESFLTLLRGAAGLFAASEHVEKAEFEAYTSPLDLARNYLGMQGVGFTQRIRAGEVRSIEDYMRRNGVADFRVWPATPRDEFHSILFLEPQDERNRAAIGFDMFTEPIRRAAMERAWVTGRAAMSGTVTLVQEIDAAKQPGFLIYFPVYQKGVFPLSEEERREQLLGFVYAPFRTWDFLERKAAPLADQHIELAVFDHAEPARGTQVFGAPPRADVNRWTQVQRVRTLPLGDRTWSAVYTARVESAVSWWTVLAGGMVATVGVSLLLRREEEALERAELSEAETRERESELALLVRAMPGLIVFVDQTGTFRLFNDRLRDWFGVDPATLVGRTVEAAARPESYARLGPFIRRALAGEMVSFEQWFNPAGPGELPARFLGVHLVPHRNAAGQAGGFYAVISDLTPHKRAEEGARFVADCSNLLLTSRGEDEMMRGLVRLAVPRVADAAVIFRVGDHARLKVMALAHIDPRIEAGLGRQFHGFELSTEGESGLAIAARTGRVAVLTKIDSAEVAVRLGMTAQVEALAALRLRTVLHIPVVVRDRVWAVLTLGTADSGRRFSESDLPLAEEISTRIRLAVENALLFAEAQQEIEDRRRAERTVRETEEHLRLFVEGARDYAMFLMDTSGIVTAWNHGAERILGFTEVEAIGMPGARIFGPEDRAAGVPEAEMATAMRVGSAPDERWHVRKDGTRFWASGHMLALRDEDGTMRGFAKIMRDLTGMKLTEEELERRVRQRTLELNEAVQELESFSYSVAHDLRSPLRSIQSFTQFTIDEAGSRLAPAERNYLDRVQRAAARLDRLISDLLAYSRVSKTRVELVPVNLGRLVGDIFREHDEFQLPRADVRIEGTLGTVVGNEAYLTQSVTNLLGNAVKFVEPGKTPIVRVWSERVGPNLRLHVRDNGIGIAPEHHARIFDIFERLHRHGTYEGTGVGLAIVRRAVHRMNGQVGVASMPGEGTTFWIELPAFSPGETIA
ncbi:MAG: hypothetical protein C0518_01605 [Opitutus sp.]|nr:hypothetical protein [Opitutus sp.]